MPGQAHPPDPRRPNLPRREPRHGRPSRYRPGADRKHPLAARRSPRHGRQPAESRKALVYAVIDHHQPPGDLEDIPFQDIRRGVGATCSVVTRYLLEQELEIPERVATGLYYG